ncbi:hypothetical protein [Streptomyces sp. S.PB5]|uniref:hypothetical protein n=1 Tax=Streptomyces sp. S.PB5 TaxID=3020844 RepID=UPI0025B0C943|nr:hypothetical protein [Streptomyces sp. S.PB5]MDN3027215.1 hypothetical protein [Streptomyces sp. S.PB5]
MLDDEEPTDPKQPRVRVGHEYVRWIRSRIADDARPVPSQGFDLEAVLTACAQAERLLWLRRAIMAVACVAGGLWIFMPLAYLAPLIVLVGLWAAYCTDRVLARRRLRALIGADEREAWGAGVPRRFRSAVERIRDGAHGEVVPYQNQIHVAGSKYHFVGAGKVWFETQIGIDVMPAKSQDGDDGQEPADGNSRLRSLPSVEELLAGSRTGDGVVRFTPDDLHAHVARELQRPIDPLPDFHPDSAQEVLGVAAISAERWGMLTRERWEGLVTLAHDGVRAADAQRAPKIARRFLCVRMTSWDGELVASLFVASPTRTTTCGSCSVCTWSTRFTPGSTRPRRKRPRWAGAGSDAPRISRPWTPAGLWAGCSNGPRVTRRTLHKIPEWGR